MSAQIELNRQFEQGRQIAKQRLLTARQAAEYLGVSTRTLWTLTDSGAVRTVRISRRVQYDIADLDEFIERCKSERSERSTSRLSPTR